MLFYFIMEKYLENLKKRLKKNPNDKHLKLKIKHLENSLKDVKERENRRLDPPNGRVKHLEKLENRRLKAQTKHLGPVFGKAKYLEEQKNRHLKHQTRDFEHQAKHLKHQQKKIRKTSRGQTSQIDN